MCARRNERVGRRRPRTGSAGDGRAAARCRTAAVGGCPTGRQPSREGASDAWQTVGWFFAIGTQIAPMPAVRHGSAAIAFYVKAFGATELWRMESGPHVVAGLEVDGAPFFLADESPEHGQRTPDPSGHTTVRIELFVDDPHTVHRRAVAAGASALAAPAEYLHATAGPRPIRRLLQGAVRDPFGHMWLSGKVSE